MFAIPADKGDPGLLRIDFEEPDPDNRTPGWSRSSGTSSFKKFEEAGLAFLYQDTLKSGEQSRFFKFVQREGTSRDARSRSARDWLGRLPALALGAV